MRIKSSLSPRLSDISVTYTTRSGYTLYSLKLIESDGLNQKRTEKEERSHLIEQACCSTILSGNYLEAGQPTCTTETINIVKPSLDHGNYHR